MDNNIIFLSFSRIVKGWAKFVKATKLCLEWEITDREVEEIKKLFRDFVVHYERYVCGQLHLSAVLPRHQESRLVLDSGNISVVIQSDYLPL